MKIGHLEIRLFIQINTNRAEGRGALQYVHSNVKPCGKKLKEYKNTQPLIGTPEPLPETCVLANPSSDFSLPTVYSDKQTWLWRSHHDLKITRPDL